MKAVEIFQLTGPQTATRLVEAPDPDPNNGFIPGEGVLVEVRAAGVAFPEVLQTRGMYQLKPELPFIPGSEVAGVVREAPPGSGFKAGDKVMAFCGLGGFAELAVAPAHLVYPLPQRFDFAQGASFILNYHTAYFALVNRGQIQRGDWVLIHGAAGGLGTAAIQVTKGLGGRSIALVSSEPKKRLAEELGADHVLLAEPGWKDRVREISEGGVQLVFDSVGGDRFLDSLRSLRAEGRLLVVGFAGGSIPEVRVNRLLLTNTAIVGVAWGGYAVNKPAVCKEIGDALHELIEAGFLNPVVGERFPLDRAAEALALIDNRAATGKVVLEVPA